MPLIHKCWGQEGGENATYSQVTDGGGRMPLIHIPEGKNATYSQVPSEEQSLLTKAISSEACTNKENLSSSQVPAQEMLHSS